MNAVTILFIVFAGIAVMAAVNLILQRHPIHSALSLIVVMVSLAALYLLLGAELLAAVQIIVYAGAIMVLFVFVIMLLNAGEEERTEVSHAAKFLGLPLALALTGLLAWRMCAYASTTTTTMVTDQNQTKMLSRLLFTDFTFPFELTSILILIAILGAVVLAKREQ